MIYYYIPDFVRHLNVNMKLLELMKIYPNMFYNDFKIGAVFGNFPNCTWNGGTVLVFHQFLENNQKYIKDIFNSQGIPLRLTMTNPMLEETDCYDRFANSVMKNFHDGFNQVLVSSPILEDYIREKYPKYPIVRSVLASHDTPYDDSDKYFMSVLSKFKNPDIEFLKSIKNKDKIELLVNETCEETCPHFKQHYLEFAKEQLYIQDDLRSVDCLYNRDFNFKKFFNSPLCITREKIKEIYEPMGFKHFKISGRGSHGSIVLFYAHYMVKPEYQNDFICLMMDSICADNY